MRNSLFATAALLCCGCAAAISVTATPAPSGDLEITVEGIDGDAGKVMVALHAESGAAVFPDAQGAIAAQWVQAAPGRHRFVFTNLPPGRFAVAVFHDENDNDELDANVLGIPTEGYGFSRDARGMFGPPSFAEAAVEVPAAGRGTTRTTTTLAY
jgi:uncharacterized protein (DUF2141 family)